MPRRLHGFVFLLATFITLTSITTYFWPLQKLSLLPFLFDHQAPNETVQTFFQNQCKIPLISPWHESIFSLIKHPREVVCRRIQPDFSYLDENGILHLNISAVKIYESDKLLSKKLTKAPEVKCRYAYFDRGRLDREIVFEPEQLLQESVRLIKNFVRVVCDFTFEVNNKTTTKIVYVNLHSHPIRIDNQNRLALSENGDDMNVLLFFLESTSSSMFRRHLPSTYDYLTRNMQSFVFDSTSKVGENTLPNLAALFTGLRLRNEQSDMKSELKQASTNDGFYDHWPFVWKRFSQEGGYVTTYAEDYTHVGTFHYSGKGFREKPVDYWYFPFWETSRLIELPEKSSKFCFGNRPIYQIFNDILFRHLSSDDWIDRRQFLFSIFSDLNHDYACDLERADVSWKEFFQNLHEKNRFNRTVLIVAGDHGPRFTSIRSTEAGFVEERLPFLALTLPPWFLKRHPDVETNLRLNKNRLTSMFDLHRTLGDVLERRFSNGPDVGKTVSGSTPNERGRSLFRPLPSNRTCFEAGIPDRYCLCDGIEIEKIDHRLADRSAALILNAARNVTKRYRTQCSKLKIEKIIYFLRLGQNGEDSNSTISGDGNFVVTYFIAFRTRPLGGIFEGAVLYNRADDSIVFKEGTLERINSFGGKGRCVPTIQLKKFCACKDDVKRRKAKR